MQLPFSCTAKELLTCPACALVLVSVVWEIQSWSEQVDLLMPLSTSPFTSTRKPQQASQTLASLGLQGYISLQKKYSNMSVIKHLAHPRVFNYDVMFSAMRRQLAGHGYLWQGDCLELWCTRRDGARILPEGALLLEAE